MALTQVNTSTLLSHFSLSSRTKEAPHQLWTQTRVACRTSMSVPLSCRRQWYLLPKLVSMVVFAQPSTTQHFASVVSPPGNWFGTIHFRVFLKFMYERRGGMTINTMCRKQKLQPRKGKLAGVGLTATRFLSFLSGSVLAGCTFSDNMMQDLAEPQLQHSAGHTLITYYFSKWCILYLERVLTTLLERVLGCSWYQFVFRHFEQSLAT